VLYNETKYEGLQRLAQFPRILFKRTSENAQNANFAKTAFSEVRQEVCSDAARLDDAHLREGMMRTCARACMLADVQSGASGLPVPPGPTRTEVWEEVMLR
jgi:hypothetical protein